MKESKTKKDLAYDTQLLKNGALVLRALDNKKRQQILLLLHTHTRLHVTQVYMKLKWSQSDASQQLAILRKQNIVISQNEGMLVYYSINYQRLNALFWQIDDFLKK